MSAFETVIRLQLDKFSPAEAKRRHIAAARAGLAAFLAGQESKPTVAIEVDGHPATTEDQVQPFGIITYRFLRMNVIVPELLAKARELSPVGSNDDARPGHPGLYKSSWFALVDGRQVDDDAVPAGAEVIITNNQPYSRKINVGAHGFERYAPPGIVERVRQFALSKYRNILDAQVVFLNLEGAYILKHDLRHIHNGRRYGAPRKDARAGMEITYPALQLTPKQF